MNRILIITLVFVLQLLLLQCKSTQRAKDINVKISNPATVEVKNEVIEIGLDSLLVAFPEMNPGRLYVKDKGQILPSEFISESGASKLLVLCSLNANANKVFTLGEYAQNDSLPVFKKLTQAELSVKEGGTWEWITKKNGNSQYEYKGGEFKNIEYLKVPSNHTDHSFFIRYEGPGWESDKVAYRFYLDWRNATDIFGKKVTENVLQNVGLDSFDSYHEPSAWGQDVFKVGNSLGIGSLGYWDGTKAVRVEKTDSVDCRITGNGLLRSEITTNYFGWQTGEDKIDVESKLSIDAGTRLTLHKVTSPKILPLLCTGIIKHEGIEAVNNFDDSAAQWVYLSTYGNQSLANDSLGLGIVVNRKYVKQIANDELNHVIVMAPIDNAVEYYFLAAWQQEKDGITNSADFSHYMNNLVERMQNPVAVQFIKQ